ncbi:MAG: hypothetical protein K6C14_04525 [Eubacterium sp.]|nr:hypothetical protein [Eubacterium sp.]
MKRIVLISIYFGKFPSNFGIWLKSAGKNESIDFLLYSDCDTGEYAFPENVKLIKASFEDIKERIQSKFDFNIVLDNPYKLCDYKPVYGYVFADDIGGYDYWGHIDIDAVLGDIRSFIPEREYEKLYQTGHLTIYKNTEENNRRFMLDGALKYKDVFTTPRICVFDEAGGMQEKFELLGIPTYISRDYADITKRAARLTLSTVFLETSNKAVKNYPYQIFYYDNGKVKRDYFIGDKLYTDEFNYIHFSSRKPEDYTDGAESFYITDCGFYKKDGETTKEIIDRYNPLRPELDRQVAKRWARDDKRKRIKNALTRIKSKL